jgi:hypothetical protein
MKDLFFLMKNNNKKEKRSGKTKIKHGLINRLKKLKEVKMKIKRKEKVRKTFQKQQIHLKQSKILN